MIAHPEKTIQQAARDVQPGEIWAFRDHRTMAEFMTAALSAENAKRPTPVERVA
jgi:hypothetical protein